MVAQNQLLAGLRVVSLAINLPGPAAARRLLNLGADVTKVEPPNGDQMEFLSAPYYEELKEGQRVVRINVKEQSGRDELWALLEEADIFLTSNRPSALAKLGLDWDSLHARAPKLSHVAIVGHPGKLAELPGHDLTYQAGVGTLQPPAMPTVLLADLAGAERAAQGALAAYVAMLRTGEGSYVEISLSDVAEDLAAPARHHLTTDGGILSGVLPGYGLYESADGWLALGALEPHFWQAVQELLTFDGTHAGLQAVLKTKLGQEWEDWAKAHGVPLCVVRRP